VFTLRVENFWPENLRKRAPVFPGKELWCGSLFVHKRTDVFGLKVHNHVMMESKYKRLYETHRGRAVVIIFLLSIFIALLFNWVESKP
jgi:hypothetical protein